MQADKQRGYNPSLVVTFCRTSLHLKNLIETSGTYVWVSLLITVLVTVLYVDTDHGGSSYREQYSLEIIIGFYYILQILKKIISSSRAVKILILSLTCEDIGVPMVTNMISQSLSLFLLYIFISEFHNIFVRGILRQVTTLIALFCCLENE